MPPENPSGPFSLPLTNLQTLLANSATFQDWVDAADADEAKARIYLIAVSEGSYTRPYALISTGDSWERKLTAGGASHCFEPSGSLFLLFEANVSEANKNSHRDAELEFANKIGAIISEMETLAGQSGYLAVYSISLKAGPSRSGEDEKDAQGDYYQIMFEISWGI